MDFTIEYALLIAGILVLALLFLAWLRIRIRQGGSSGAAPMPMLPNHYLGGDHKGNYVWGGAMNLAWNELTTNILRGKAGLETSDTETLHMLDALNEAAFSTNDLDAASYYVDAGFGPEAVDRINRETGRKFPGKRIGKLEIELSPEDFISYAYLLKAVEYETQFKSSGVAFMGKRVKGFKVQNGAQRKNVEVVLYDNDDRFVVRLRLKAPGDELILAKGYDMTSPEEVLAWIRGALRKNHPSLGAYDLFEAPCLHLAHRRNYEELTGKAFSNPGFEGHFIAQMLEHIRFDMDEKGARVENEAVIVAARSAPASPGRPRRFILDKPYWVILQRACSANPYFMLGVNNTALMENQ